MRIFSAGLVTETNTFAPWPTGVAGFARHGLFRGDASEHAAESELGCMAAEWKRLCTADGHTLHESLFTMAEPSGRAVRHDYEALRDEILHDLRSGGPFEVALFVLHGAMVADGYDDCEGDLLARAREILGPTAAIGAVLDPHCHLTQKMIDTADAIVLIKEYPHIDLVERGAELYSICVRAAMGQVRPVMRMFDCRMVGFYPTTQEPMAGIVRSMKEMELRPGVLSVSFAHGFPWGDTPDNGSRTLGITDGDAGMAEAIAEEIGRSIYDAREAMLPRYPDLRSALEQAAQMPGLVVLADTADNAGGGAPADSMAMLEAMLEAQLVDAAFGCVWDPITVQTCMEAGLGARLELRIGGKCGRASGTPLDVIATVCGLAETHSQQDLSDSRAALGAAAWVQIEGIDVVLVSQRTQTFAPDAFTGLGIELANKKVVGVKSSWHFQAHFAPLASHIIAVATPGALQMDFAALDYRKKRDLDFYPRVADPLSR